MQQWNATIELFQADNGRDMLRICRAIDGRMVIEMTMEDWSHMLANMKDLRPRPKLVVAATNDIHPDYQGSVPTSEIV